jgi:hypothetical protein
MQLLQIPNVELITHLVRSINCIHFHLFLIMSVYTEFVKKHIGNAPGKTQAERMRAVAAMWRRQKSGGKGLYNAGSHGGDVDAMKPRKTMPATFDNDHVYDGPHRPSPVKNFNPDFMVDSYYATHPKAKRISVRGGSVYRPGARLVRQSGMNDWSDYGDRLPINGEGFFDDLWDGIKGAAKIAGPRLIDAGLKRYGMGSRKRKMMAGDGLLDDLKGGAKRLIKKHAPGGVDKLIGAAGNALAGAAGKKLGPQAEALIRKALDFGGAKLGKFIKGKIEGWGIRHASMHLKHIMKSGGAIPMKRQGGALSGMISAKQRAALAAHIRRGGKIGGDAKHGALSDLLKGLTVKIE